MKWFRENGKTRKARLNKITKWFAWYPVAISREGGEDIVWLQTIYRKPIEWDTRGHSAVYAYWLDDFDLLKKIDKE